MQLKVMISTAQQIEVLNDEHVYTYGCDLLLKYSTSTLGSD